LLYLVVPAAGAGIQLGLVISAIGLFFYGTGNIGTAAVMDVSAAGVQGTTMSVMSVFRQIFTIPSPIIAGFIVTRFGRGASFYYAAALLLVGALVLLSLRSRLRYAAPRA
jgi:MFS-type transporter involved in bile tolerance (Atg22 family)